MKQNIHTGRSRHYQFPSNICALIQIFLKTNCWLTGVKNKYTEDVTERRRDVLKITFLSSKIKSILKKKE